MDLSIVIVNYNVKYFLEQCLHSVINAGKGIRYEIFVVDNNSVDGSCAMVKESFPQVLLIENKHNIGFSKANNQAIKKAKGKYILLLNPDTMVQEDTLEKCIHFMDNHPHAGSMGVKMINGKGRFLPESKRSLPTPWVSFCKIFGLSTLFPKSKKFGKYHLSYFNKEQIHEVEVLPGAFMFLRKKVLDQIGLLDERFFMYGEDIDLSYRITQAGFTNYYYPDTTIIHYKGESTKKGSVNYVLVFYNAMIIFANKHFTRRNASIYSLLINLAIFFRAGIAILRRFLNNLIVPVFDALFIFAGFYFFRSFWEGIMYNQKGYYPEEFLLYVVPSYILIWLLFLYLSGGYERPVKAINVLKGVSLGTIIILIIYALLPEKLRFSRALVLIGAIWTYISTFLVRGLLYVLNKKSFGFEFFKKRKKLIIVGSLKESDRVYSILKKTSIKPELIGIVNPNNSTKDNLYIGNIDQIEEIVQINKADELIFCAQDIRSKDIIKTMLGFTNLNLNYKIAPPRSLSIIGSNSINTAGDFYTVHLNSIALGFNQRKKRIFDFLSSLVLLICYPILAFFVRKPLLFFINICKVLAGFNTWVGYTRIPAINISALPALKNGILSPKDSIAKEVEDAEILERLNMMYAKDYKVVNDLMIVLSNIKSLGSKI